MSSEEKELIPHQSFTSFLSLQPHSFIMVAGIKLWLAALLPVALACNGYTGGVPKAVGTKTNKAVITVKAGQTFDGKWNRYDRGAGACNGQGEGGKLHYTHPALLLSRILTSSLPPQAKPTPSSSSKPEPL